METQYSEKVLNPRFVVELRQDRFTLWNALSFVGIFLQSFVLALIFATSYVFLTQPAEAMRFVLTFIK